MIVFESFPLEVIMNKFAFLAALVLAFLIWFTGFEPNTRPTSHGDGEGGTPTATATIVRLE